MSSDVQPDTFSVPFVIGENTCCCYSDIQLWNYVNTAFRHCSDERIRNCLLHNQLKSMINGGGWVFPILCFNGLHRTDLEWTEYTRYVLKLLHNCREKWSENEIWKYLQIPKWWNWRNSYFILVYSQWLQFVICKGCFEMELITPELVEV